ncbi:MAG: hypothetical protein OHK0052_01120 [Anaerolineales bacterium]
MKHSLSKSSTILRMNFDSLLPLLQRALQARHPLMAAAPNTNAWRLFNGFTEGLRGVMIERYAESIVIHNLIYPPQVFAPLLPPLGNWLRRELPQTQSILLKSRSSNQPAQKRGTLLYGSTPARQILEEGIPYAINLTLNQDCSFYLDTRNLRQWIRQHAAGRRVLNTFAYTGSLGVAAAAADAAHVTQTDQNTTFLKLAQTSYNLNDVAMQKITHIPADFFEFAARLRRQQKLFDLILLDPPVFSRGARARVDLQQQYTNLLNKLRPLVAHEGWLIAINNALFVSGETYLQTINALTNEHYIRLETLIPIPQDCLGYPPLTPNAFPTDPAPFNHPTKIAVLHIRRKDER